MILQILCSVDPKQIPRLSQNDNEIYEKFRKDFPNMNVAKLNEMDDLKSNEMKAKWRSFCEEFKHVEDYSFATLVRLDSRQTMKQQILESVHSYGDIVPQHSCSINQARTFFNASILTKIKPENQFQTLAIVNSNC